MRRLLPRLGLALASGVLLPLAGCGNRPDDSAPVVVPTQEEADEIARQRINSDNADAEYEKLRTEIEADIEKQWQ